MPDQDAIDSAQWSATNKVDAGRERGQQAIKLGEQFQGPFPLWGCLSPIEQERIRHAVGTYIVDLIQRAGGTPSALLDALRRTTQYTTPTPSWPESMQHSNREAQAIA